MSSASQAEAERIHLKASQYDSGARPEINVGFAERWASVAAGSALVGLGLWRRSPLAFLGALGGGYLLYRGSTGRCTSSLLREGLRRFKQLIETGEISTIEGQSSGRAGPRPDQLNLYKPSSRIERALSPAGEDAVDEASSESFPASDAPGWTTGIAKEPSERPGAFRAPCKD